MTNTDKGASDERGVGHTPGPWCVARDIHDDRIGIGSASGVVVFAPRVLSEASGVRNLVDARLIAAAPDLLSASEHARELIGAKNDTLTEAQRQSNTNQAWHILSTAIARARGTS